jgi:putative oxidoreductase
MSVIESRARVDRPEWTVRERHGRMDRFTNWIHALLHRNSLAALRIALGAVYVWFGAMKLAGTTPVGSLVEATTPWADPSWFVPVMGAVEVWFALPVFVGHMLGTFGVLVMVPEVAFQGGNPLNLTVEGEFVVKNLVLLAAVVVVATRTGIRRRLIDSPVG